MTSFGSLLSAQEKRNTEYNPDKALKSNARINPSTLAMELSIPISGYPGRSGNMLPLSFDYSSKVWEIQALYSWESTLGVKTDTRPTYAKKTVAGWNSNLASPRMDAHADIFYNMSGGASRDGEIYTEVMSTNPPAGSPIPLYYVKRIHIQMPDGSTHEFRESDTIILCGDTSTGCAEDYNGTYYSVDNTKMRLERATNESVLWLADGSRYIFGTYNSSTDLAGHLAHTYIDRHGNRHNYNASNRQWTDTLGRVVTDPLPLNLDTQNQTVGDVTASFPSKNNSTLSVTFSWRYLKDPAGGESGLNNPNQNLAYLSNIYCQGNSTRSIATGPYLFGNPEASIIRVCAPGTSTPAPPFNPVVLTRLTLPNGQTYQFKYNLYGEIEKIIYPSGAYERFAYSKISSLQSGGPSYDQANRGVSDRWLSATGNGTDEIHWTYQAVNVISPTVAQRIITTQPDGSRHEQDIYVDTSERVYGFDNQKSGRPYETRVYGTNNQLLRRSLTAYEVTGALPGGYAGATRDIRPVREISITFEAGQALATMSETVYDTGQAPPYFSSLNPKIVRNHHYLPIDVNTAQTADVNTIAALFGAGTLAQISETDYLYNASYQARNLVTLPVETRVKDAAGAVRARSQIGYDEAAYPILAAGTDAQWTDPGTSLRGNVTTTRTWTDIANNQSVETHAQYDNFGNLRKAWDARGVLSETDYDAAYRFAYPTAARTAAPDPSGQRGSATAFQTTTTYDLTTGLPLTVTDANGQTTQMQYNDALLRPTRVIPPAGGAITETVYNDTPGNLWVKTRNQIDATNWKEAITYFDGLGRTRATQSVDNQGDVFTETEYDQMGKVKRVTNPFRNGETKLWTVTNYDAAGRPYQVVTPDGAMVQTAYGLSTTGNVGSVVTVTDQAGKQRRSITNALGQLVRLDEPDDSGNLGTVSSPAQPTSYLYDALNNLVQVNQGVQQRNFSYDSLSRLRQATNPESGTINYAYDSNGNLTQKTDARNVATTYAYDNLNRVINRTYTDGTPQVTYTYDNLPNAKGKLIQVSSAISTTNYSQFDVLGRVLASQQVTDSSTFNFGYQYNLAGMLTQQTYPSGRTVTNSFESDGDLAQVGGSSQGSGKVYAGSFAYTAAGAVSAMQLGNGRWENTQFNSRLQPVQIGLGSSATDQSLWKINYDYGSTDNNGNVKSQQITVPNQFQANQVYTYDSLNRLKSATETISGSQTWKQTFQFDRYGNRSFDASQTTTLGNCPPAVCNPAISQTNNRVQSHQFDNAGNTTVDAEGRSFYYDGENKQKEVRDVSNNIIGQYLYDGDGKRVKKIAANDTTIFVYDGAGKLASEYTQSASQSQTPNTSYLTNDTLGSPRVTTDQAGNVVSRRDFRPFGEEINRPNQGTDKVRQKFTSYERDNESDLDFAQARMYSNKLGRFYSVDPENAGASEDDPQSWNGYAYVRNNPIILVDPNGLDYKVCYSNGQCFNYTNKEFANYTNSLPDGFNATGSQKNGSIIDPDGNNLASYTYFTTADQDAVAAMTRGAEPTLRVWGPVIDFYGTHILPFFALPPGSGAAVDYLAGTVAREAVTQAVPRIVPRVLPVLGKCFVAGTPILTENGLKPIEEIKKGDKVLSYDEKTKQNEYKTVVRTFIRFAEAEELLSVQIEGEAELLGVTNKHPFYVRVHKARDNTSSEDDEGEWIEAGKLQAGDEIRKAEGSWARIQSITQQSKGAKVYNFEVEDNHNYFVGQTSLLAHNPNYWVEIKEAAKKLANDILKEAKNTGVGTGARSGQHGKPYSAAARELRELLKKEGKDWLPEFKEVVEKKIVEFEKKAGGINHAVK